MLWTFGYTPFFALVYWCLELVLPQVEAQTCRTTHARMTLHCPPARWCKLVNKGLHHFSLFFSFWQGSFLLVLLHNSNMTRRRCLRRWCLSLDLKFQSSQTGHDWLGGEQTPLLFPPPAPFFSPSGSLSRLWKATQGNGTDLFPAWGPGCYVNFKQQTAVILAHTVLQLLLQMISILEHPLPVISATF